MATKQTRPARSAGWHFTRQAFWPTAPAAIERMKKGDRVPVEEHGQATAPAGAACDPADFDPFIWQSLLRNRLVAREAGYSDPEPEPMPVPVPAPTRPVVAPVASTDDDWRADSDDV